MNRPLGVPGRTIENDFVKRIRAAEGDVENGLIFCGSTAFRDQRIQTVPEGFRQIEETQ